ncbi:oligopeptide ABC transporter substrate-binding protein [Tissierella sp.]|uniref:oligopeptide ABC transporter substrate-binding protein n=1 Tax=Tissierella sp. TaxID=41274 RepID=UPI002865BA50|nr:oligopeptide ABC transporter substrate-binding protein [Tissierella sp.]MDR7856827.1 oligopeptide ABC transporter substrate-binding protein [Tissierella sp.]
MKRSWKIIIPLMLVLTLLLTSCGKKDVDVPEVEEPTTVVEETTPDTEEPKPEEPGTLGTIELPYPKLLKKDGATVGGTLNVALVTATPFEGIFNTFLYSNNVDAQLMGPTNGTFMKSGPNYEIADGGYCNVEFNREAKTATYKIHKDLTWSDGVPVTADDLIFVYESIAGKDYTGVRFDGDYKNVVGIEEYYEGTADTISGLKKIDDKTLEVSFKEFYPGILWGAGLTYNAEPAHYLKDIPLADMEGHDKVRVKPLSCGPFMVSNIVAGESVEYVPNPYWFGEKPKVDKIVYKRTSPDTIVEALKAGTFDIVDGINVNSYPEYKDLENIELLSSISTVYGYVGFKHGKWDTEAKTIVMDPSKKMADVKLRQAIAYSMNNEEVGEVFYNGLRIPANALVTPAHGTFWNSGQERYEYNPEKAKQILDEAGYVDKDGDGMREDPSGNKLKINFLSMSGGDIAEPLSQFYVQCWREVGLDVGLQNGRLIEMNAFYDMVEEDNPDIDLYMGAWSTGSNPDPSGLYGRDALFNYPRFASEENDKLLAAIASEDAFGATGIDNDYLIKAYHDWQKHVHEQVVVAPTHYRINLSAINNRVNYWDLNVVSEWGWEKIGLLSDTPEKAK